MKNEKGHSTLPFEVGDTVIERIGIDREATNTEVKIEKVDGNICTTSTGRTYDRRTGGRVPINEKGYRALHGTMYSGRGKEL